MFNYFIRFSLNNRFIVLAFAAILLAVGAYQAMRLPVDVLPDLSRSRCWFIDAWFDYEECGEEYCWTAKVQQVWFERFGLWSEACPKLCPKCRARRRKLNLIRNRYGLESKHAILRSTDLKTKQRVLELIDEIEHLSEEPLTKGIIEKRAILKRQIEKLKTNK